MQIGKKWDLCSLDLSPNCDGNENSIEMRVWKEMATQSLQLDVITSQVKALLS